MQWSAPSWYDTGRAWQACSNVYNSQVCTLYDDDNVNCWRCYYPSLYKDDNVDCCDYQTINLACQARPPHSHPNAFQEFLIFGRWLGLVVEFVHYVVFLCFSYLCFSNSSWLHIVYRWADSTVHLSNSGLSWVFLVFFPSSGILDFSLWHSWVPGLGLSWVFSVFFSSSGISPLWHSWVPPFWHSWGFPFAVLALPWL